MRQLPRQLVEHPLDTYHSIRVCLCCTGFLGESASRRSLELGAYSCCPLHFPSVSISATIETFGV